LCANTDGSFECTCIAGYDGDGVTCSDIDECALELDDCSDFAACSNTEGGYACACNAGFKGDGASCIDIDECSLGLANCDVQAICSNNNGGFECVCKDGFEGDGTTCADIDECAQGLVTCENGKVCLNNGGGYWCVCPKGYKFNKVQQLCVDKNECLWKNNGGCAPMTECINLPGSNTCGPCPEGTIGDSEVGCTIACPNSADDIDTDGDGVCDLVDNCPTVSNSQQLSAGGDGAAGDACSGVATVVAAVAHSCVLDSEGLVNCWGDIESMPAGTFKQLSSGAVVTCGLTTDGEIDCWAPKKWAGLKPPAGPFNQIAMGSSHGCALDMKQEPVCWGSKAKVDATPKGVKLVQISVGYGHACGIRPDGTLLCWGSNTQGQADAPEGTFVQVETGYSQTCGLRTDGTAQCWGYLKKPGKGGAPAIGFKIVNGKQITCWAGAGGCSTGKPTFKKGPPADTTFVTISLTADHACGIKPDGTLACWGDNWHGEATPPEGQFVSITTGNRHSCAVGVDGQIQCWGYKKSNLVAPAL